MSITEEKNGSVLILKIDGRLDTTTSPVLEEKLNEIEDVTELVFDFETLEYISSAGLRCLLKAQKIMNKKGSMKVIHVNELVYEVFEVTGFNEILTIE